MARLAIEPDRVRVHLDWWEKLALRRSHLTVPLRSITDVVVVDDAEAMLGDGRFEHSVRIPGLTAAGTLTTEDGTSQRTFAVCHRKQPGLVLTLQRATFHRIVLTTGQADNYAEQIRRHLGGGEASVD